MKRPPPQTRLPVIQVQERRLSGKELGFSAVGFAAATEGFEAGRVSWHRHDTHEILMMLRGAAEYEFPNGKRSILAGDQFMVVPRRMKHRGSKNVRGPSVICAVTLDPRDSNASHTLFTKQEMAWIAAQCAAADPVARPMNATLRRMAHHFHQAVCNFPRVQPPLDVVAAMRLQIAGILLEIARHSGGGDERSCVGTVAAVMAHMERHFADDLQMNELAELVNCSRSHLFTAFRRETGMSPNDWLQRLRVKKAGELLTTTNRSGADIALSVGFASQPYFCHVFRKYTGKTPGEHRSETTGK